MSLRANSGDSSALATRGPKRSLNAAPTATAATTAAKPSTSRRATLAGTGAATRRGSTSADSTAAPIISQAMKR